jgi:phosphoribosylformylglycinamidine cyclo-ligase
MYAGEDYDLAGFCVGIVEKERIVDGSDTRAGDVVIGLPSSGPHSNGYSLIRKLLQVAKAGHDTQLDGERLYDLLLAPTRIYVKPLLALLAEVRVHGIAHITGGGLLENIPRVVPDGLEVVLKRSSWPSSPVFNWLQRVSSLPDVEMYRTFNCGIGMTLSVAADDVSRTLTSLARSGQPASVIGSIQRGTRGVVIEA